MPIKTAHITNYYHKDSGGIRTAYNSLLAAAERRKCPMFLIVPGETEEVVRLSDYTKIYYVPASTSPLADKRYRLIMPWQYIPNGSIVRRILMEEMPDVIEVRDKYALSIFGTVVRIGKFEELNRPMLVSYSSERMDDNVATYVSKGRFFRWIARRYMGNYIIPSFDYHMTNSPYTAEEFFLSTLNKHNPRRMNRFTNWCWRRLRGPRVPLEERVRIRPPGVNIDTFSRDRKDPAFREAMIRRSGGSENSVLIIYAGRIAPEKNVALLVDLMDLLSKDGTCDYRLLVAGGGPLAEWLQDEADKRCPGRITQLGHLDKAELANYYANADVFVHPNPREPFGIGPLEAMASGVPVVVPDSGGLLSYASDENAWVTPPAAESYAAAIVEIVSQPDLRSQKISRAFEAVEANVQSNAAERMLETYHELFDDFNSRKELFADTEAAKKFDYISLLG